MRLDDTAEAADVGRMTVFNHFARKEDLFFDRDEEGRETLRNALPQRDPRIAPLETLRLLAHWLIAEQTPYPEFFPRSQDFIETVERSTTPIARAREIRNEIAHLVTVAVPECVGRKATDPNAHLPAGLLLAPRTVAFIEAHRTFRQSRNTKEATAVLSPSLIRERPPESRNGRHALG